jgi:hypothetical protein
MSYDYSTIIAMYKDGMELFKLYEGSDLLWEKPTHKRVYMWINDLSNLGSVIDSIYAMTGEVINIDALSNLIASTTPESCGGLMVEIQGESDSIGNMIADLMEAKIAVVQEVNLLDGTAVMIDMDGINNAINDVFFLNGSATPQVISPADINIDSKFNLKSSIVVSLDTNAYIAVKDTLNFSENVNIQLCEVCYIPNLNAISNVQDAIKVIITEAILARSVSSMNFSDSVYVELGNILKISINQFESISAYANCLKAAGLFTSINSTDQQLQGLGKVTMYRLSELGDFDSLYLYNMDESTLQQLRLVEE